jgi:hypothetical protein
MEVIRIQRLMNAINAGRQVGLRPEQSRLTVGQQNTARRESEVLGLPVDPRYWAPLQSPDGELFFMLGYDALGSKPLA